MLRRPFQMTSGELWAYTCNSACPYFGTTKSSGWRAQRTAKSCLSNITHADTQTFVEQFVGEMDSDAAACSRKHRVEDFFHDSWIGDKTFIFHLGRSQVCETACAFLLGYVYAQEDGLMVTPTSLWKQAKKNALAARSGGTSLAELRHEALKVPTIITGAHIFLTSKYTCD